MRRKEGRGTRWGICTSNTVRRYWGDKAWVGKSKSKDEYVIYEHDGDDTSIGPTFVQSFSYVAWYPYINVNKAKGWEIVENEKTVKHPRYSIIEEYPRKGYVINDSKMSPSVELVSKKVQETPNSKPWKAVSRRSRKKQASEERTKDFIQSRIPKKGDKIMWVRHNYEGTFVRQDTKSRNRAKFWNDDSKESRAQRKQQLKREYGL